MALTTIEPVESFGFPAFPLALGQTTVSATEVANELKSRGFIRGAAPATPTVTPTVTPTPTISRTDAIRAAVDKSLTSYGYPITCKTAGGCYISDARFDTIVAYAVQLANFYLAQGRISGLSGLGLGQAQTTPPGGGLTTGELIAWGLKAVATLASQGADFYLAYQQRKQWEAMGYQIPQYTSAQVDAILKQYMAQNPSANEAQMRQIAQGALVGESKTPEWLWPLVIGGIVVVGVMATRR